MSSLLNQIIIAAPHMMDNLFSKSVIFICEHNSNGAVGLIINKRLDAVLSSQIYGDLNKKVGGNLDQSSPLYIGGPVSVERGIMLHDKKILLNSSIEVSKNLFMSSHLDVLKMAHKNSKCSYKFMMGYSGWSSGQLENELENGDWIIQDTSADFVFNCKDDQMWKMAIGSYGFDISNLSSHGAKA